jgi:hypothetical protein
VFKITGVSFGVPNSELGLVLRAFCPIVEYKSAILISYKVFYIKKERQ